MTINQIAGSHPIQRLGSLLLVIGIPLAIYDVITTTDISSSYWLSSLASSVPHALRCAIQEPCFADSSWVVAVWCICLGLLLRFALLPVWQWLHAGSPQR